MFLVSLFAFSRLNAYCAARKLLNRSWVDFRLGPSIAIKEEDR
jgi:hypothetical protein